jgi:hypothetical protein
VGAIFFETLKNLAYAQLREIRMNQVISTHANFNGNIKKFLVAFRDENLFVNAAAKGYFSGYVSLPKNFSASPAAIFATPIDIEKLMYDEVLILVNLVRGAIQNQKGCCTF